MNKAKLAHEPLTNDELPTPGTLVAIDAEFVSLQKVQSASLRSRVDLPHRSWCQGGE
jgi:hypothetical protein